MADACSRQCERKTTPILNYYVHQQQLEERGDALCVLKILNGCERYCNCRLSIRLSTSKGFVERLRIHACAVEDC